MKPEYTDDVIESLENTFGELENRESLADAVLSAAKNAVEDNIPDYLGDLMYAADDSFLYGLSEDMITTTPHGMWTETETSGAMTPTMTAQTIISIGYIRTMFPRRRKTGSKKKSTTAQPPEQISSVSPADLAMKSERCILMRSA